MQPAVSRRETLTAALLLASGCASRQNDAMQPRAPSLSAPIVIAHRGASGLRPEHTLASYELAIEQGADFIEPDLVPTKDGVLVVRHENDISDTTDVAKRPEFADRRATKTIDGKKVTGWFTEDFTLAELKTLRAKERLPLLRPANTAYDGRFEIPTLAEIITLAKRESVARGRIIGIYPETKHPTYFSAIGLGTDEALVAELHAAGWRTPSAPVFIQSFEVENLRKLRALTDLRLIQLLDEKGAPADGARTSYVDMATPDGLRAIARYAWGIGPNKNMIEDGALVRDAHAAGLRVHPWTFRAENYFLPRRYRKGLNPRGHGALASEIEDALALGVDGFFTDFPQIGVEARATFDAPRAASE
jgi:glycerophosphoryl diester phosphodiesterase